MKSGVYFGLPDEEYHAQEALSNSGIKWLAVSPMDFWARSWMNPEYEFETSPQMELGTAYHTRILEGADLFYQNYAEKIEPQKNELVTSMHFKDRLKELGGKISGNKDVLIERLLELEPTAPIYDTRKEKYYAKHAGKTFLKTDEIKRIEYSAAMIEKHPILSKCFSGGSPEVSIFWTDASGIQMKSRLDYLKPTTIVDLKTFSNPLSKPIDRAIKTSMAGGKYHIQTAMYIEAVEQAKKMISAGLVHGKINKKWLELLCAQDEQKFVFVFQQTGVAPVARAYVMPRAGAFQVGQVVIDEMKAQFKKYMAKYGTDPWVDDSNIDEFRDEEFPAYMWE